MNENEMKMIKEMAEMLIDAQDKCELNPCDECEHQGCREGCWHYLSATELYKKGGRIVAEDEIVIKQTDYVELNKDFYDWKKEYDHNCLLRLEVFELEKQLEKAKQETARKIAAKLKQHIAEIREFYEACIDVSYRGLTEQDIDDTLRELGIELE